MAKRAPLSAGVEPTVRTFTLWTPSRIRAAELGADAGNLREAASLCEWILSDSRAQSTLSTRVQALLGLTPSFEASGDKRRSSRVVRALEVQEDWWAAYPEDELAQIHTWGLLLGLGPARHEWEAVEGHSGRILPRPAFWHPQHLRFDWNTREWKTRVASGGFDSGVEQTLVPGDGTWILHTPYGKNRPWSLGLWRGLARFLLLKWYALQDWARHSERGSVLVGTSGDDQESTADQRSQLAQDIYDRGREAVVVLPSGFDLKLVESVANTKNLYEAQIRMADEAIAVAVRGGNLTTTVQQGSLAATETQAKFGDQQRLAFDAQVLPTTIHDQSLVWWAEFNFGDRTLAPWPVYPVEEPKDTKGAAEAADKAAEAAKKFTDLGFEIDREVFAEEFGMSAWLKPGTPPPKPTAPTNAPPTPPPPGQLPPANPNEPAPGVKPPPKAKALLAAAGGARRGFLAGQLYTDAVAEETAELAAAALEPTLDALREEIAAAADYDDLRERLRARYAEDMDAEELTELVAAAMVLASFAGRAAVNQDAGS